MNLCRALFKLFLRPINRAAIAASGDYLFFMNSDMVFVNDVVSFLFEKIDDNPLSTPQLIEKLSKALGFKPRLFYFPSLFSRPCRSLFTGRRCMRNMVVDSRKINHYLGWKPIMTMDDGIRKTIQWYLEQKSAK